MPAKRFGGDEIGYESHGSHDSDDDSIDSFDSVHACDWKGAVLMKSEDKDIDAGLVQGDTNDCYFLTLIAALAHRNPKLLRDAVLYDRFKEVP